MLCAFKQHARRLAPAGRKALTTIVVFSSIYVYGQFKNGNQTVILELPRQSQRGQVSQRIGLTDITVTYHRPQVKGRKIWGGVVPYGKPWRAGANEITKIEFSDPVKIDGKPLAKGAYGLHLIPGEASWIAVFSNDSTAWGSFTYDPKDDALRVAVKPVTNDMHETLTYEFYPVGPDSAVLNLMWEKISVPLKIVVDVKPIALASIRRQLNTLAQYTAMAWDDAARYMLDNDWELQEAMSYVETSIRKEENFGNMLTKAELLQKLGKTEESVQYWERAIKNTEPIQVHMYARQLQAQGQQEQAFRVFELNAKTHPEVWIVHAGLARVYSARSDFAKALKEMRVAAEHAPEKQKASLQKQIQQLEVNEDINQ